MSGAREATTLQYFSSDRSIARRALASSNPSPPIVKSKRTAEVPPRLLLPAGPTHVDPELAQRHTHFLQDDDDVGAAAGGRGDEQGKHRAGGRGVVTVHHHRRAAGCPAPEDQVAFPLQADPLRLPRHASRSPYPSLRRRRHAVIVVDGVDRDGRRGPRHGTQGRRIGEERRQREHLGHGDRLPAGARRYGPRPVREYGGGERDRRHDVPKQHADDLERSEPPGDGHDAEGRRHEQLVGDRIDQRAERGGPEPAGERSVEQVARGRDRENDQAPLIGDEGECDGQRDAHHAQQVGGGPSEPALIPLRARTSFGHLAPFAGR